MFRYAFAFALAVALCAAPVSAATLAPTGLLSGFSTIVLGDLDARAETEGNVFVGGTYSGGASVNPDAEPEVDFGGGLSGSFFAGAIGENVGGANVLNGDAVIGGAVPRSSRIAANNGTVRENVAGLAATAADVAETFEALTGMLQGLAATGGVAETADQNRVRFESVAGADGLAVFDIDGEVLRSGTFLGVAADPGVTTVFNVRGTDVTVGINANVTDSRVLFNFHEAERLTVNSTFNYSILAAGADVTLQGGGVFGTVVAGRLRQFAEIRPESFSGRVPAPVPLPASGLMLLSALAVLALRRR